MIFYIQPVSNLVSITIDWQGYYFYCSGDCDSRNLPGVTDRVGQVTIKLNKGDTATVTRRQEQPIIVDEFYEFQIKEFDPPFMFGCFEPLEVEQSP